VDNWRDLVPSRHVGRAMANHYKEIKKKESRRKKLEGVTRKGGSMGEEEYDGEGGRVSEKLFLFREAVRSWAVSGLCNWG
jgi:hypothetical protein